ncbi:alpha/beta hydrolase [Neptuniibacter sp. QD48_55]|uniref:alpha/beta hydrolase n=1 Tax=Neptuniibacter sp. QD48_55 TaxID=3398212 RepID=UPI0039F624A2
MKKAVFKFIFLAGFGYLLLCAFLYFNQDNLLYFPQERKETREEHTLLIPTEVGNTVVTIQTRNTGKALIYFGGNAEDVSQRLAKFKQTFPEHSLYLMHYRGYGSDGTPREEAIYQDALALYQQVAKDNAEIVLMGRSLGTGIATRLAAEKKVQQLILITPYSSIEDVASERYWGIPVSLLLKDKYLSWQYAPRVKATTAILLAGRDTVISKTSSMKLFNSFRNDLATIYKFETAGHNSISSESSYYPLLNKLCRSRSVN